ncbi:MAG TPA: hypothetical protein PKA63_00635 [Oligoflexia bacterium]|nr:hypothetical protein [Oligoflexia bacterium]HMP47156.1 hypothetical protein [Oligoflexia bacterium]
MEVCQDIIKNALSSVRFVICEEVLCSFDNVYMVGGGVRDILLGYPVDDLDFIVSENPESGIEKIRQRLLGLPIVLSIKDDSAFDRYRTHKFFVETADEKIVIDVVFPRKEFYPSPGSRPEIAKGSLIEDLLRRDFTINSLCLSCSPAEGSGFIIIDHVGGYRDLLEGNLRVLHELSFRDDPVRIIRGIRFMSRFSFRWESSTELLLRDKKIPDYMAAVSIGRRVAEFCKIAYEPDPIEVILKIENLNLLSVILTGARFPSDIRREYEKFMISIPASGFFKDVPEGSSNLIFLAFVLTCIEEVHKDDFVNNLTVSRATRRVIREIASSRG